MARKPTPTPEIIRQLLRYEPDSGKLYWRYRDQSFCASAGDALRWNNTFANKEAFTSLGADGYRVGAVLTKPLLAHRVAWALATGAWPTGQIDHINGIRTDNRFENLRDIPAAENGRNRKRQHDSTSGVTGVIWHSRDQVWQARIGDGSGGRTHLGYFQSFAEAVQARKSAECEMGYHPNHGR